MDLDLTWLLWGLPLAFAAGWLASRFDLHQWRLPVGTKEQVHMHRRLVVQRKGEEGKKNGCLEQPHEVFQVIPFVAG